MAKAKKSKTITGYNITKSDGRVIYRKPESMTHEIKQSYTARGWKVTEVED